jgi:sulfur-oxidizing protein SoxY
MSDSSAPLFELHPADEIRRGTRRRLLLGCGHALLGATLFPALRLRAQTVAAGLNAVKPAFGAGSLTEAFRLLGADPTPSDEVSLNVPDFVENGATVPVEVSTQLPGVQEIFILSEANPFPLVARFSVPEGTDAFVSVRIKVASSCNIHALVHSEGRFLSAVKATTVTVGGCGA